MQIDEPVLTLDLPDGAQPPSTPPMGNWPTCRRQIKICLATYFGAGARTCSGLLGCRWPPSTSIWSAPPSNWTRLLTSTPEGSSRCRWG